MKAFSLAFCLLAWGLMISAIRAEETKPAFSISHNSALETITVQDGKLHYLYHRQRTDSFFTLQSYDGYDRFDIQVWLSKEELAAFRDWMDRNKVFDLPEKYESKDEKSIGSAYHSGMTVVQGDRQRAIAWDGDSKTPESLGTAVTELIKMVDDIAKSRTK